MRLFRWTTNNATFVPQIDSEHRTVFHLAEQLRQAVEKGAEPPQVQHLLGEMLDHCEEHFGHEERIMLAMNCPFFNWHKGQHDTVRKRVRQFVPQLEGADSAAAELLLEFFSEWLEDHTRLADRMLGAYVRNYERAHPAMAS
jgi:hemerythrin